MYQKDIIYSEQLEGRMGNCANTEDVAGNNGKESDFYASATSRVDNKKQDKSAIQPMVKFNNKSLKLPPVYKDSYQTIETYLDSTDQQQLFKLGKAYHNLMFYNHAISTYLRSLKHDTKQHNQRKTKLQLIDCYVEIGKYEQALQKCTEIEKETKQNYGEGSEQYIRFLIKKAVCESSMARISQAKSTFSQAISVIQKNGLTDRPDHCTLYSKLAGLYINEGEIEMGVQMVKKAQYYASKLETTLEASEAMIELSHSYETLGFQDRASQLLERAQSIIKQKAGIQSVEYVNMLLFQIAFARNCQAYQECLDLINQCNQAILKMFGKESIQYAELKCEQGLFHLAKSNNVTAIKCFNQSFEIFEVLEEQVNQACPLILIQKVVAYLKIGSQNKTQQICEKTYKLVNQIYGENSIQAAQIGSIFVQIMFENDYLEVAEESCLQIVQIYEGLKLQQCASNIKAIANLGRIFQAKGEYENALKYFNMGLRLFQNQTKNNPLYVQLCQCFAEVYRQQGLDEAQKQYKEQSREIREKLNKFIEGLEQKEVEQIKIG